jgi:multidrug efflux system membrane fusion protein
MRANSPARSKLKLHYSMSQKQLLRAIAFGASASVLLSITGCGGKAPAAQGPPPPVVTVAPVQEQEVTEWDEFTGRTDAVESVEIRPRVSGQIEQVCFQSGQLVKQGDVLFVIDRRPYKANLDQRQAEYVQAQARLANSERDATRSKRLLTSKTISSEEADATDSQFQEAKAAVLAAKAIVDSAQLDYEFTEVRAPISGRVSRALLTTGNYVSGTAGAASLLTTIVSVDPVYVYADVDENSILKFNALASTRGNGKVPVELELADEDGFPHKGVIESFDNRIDANTGTILLRAVFPNTDGRIVPGLFARIRMSAGGRQNAILVDESAIGTDQAQKFVLTLGDKNTAEYRQVKLGPVIDGKRIVRSGLKAGEKIIVNGQMHARPGMPVTPQEQVVADASTTDAAEKTAKR